jgi:hypothetical protein
MKQFFSVNDVIYLWNPFHPDEFIQPPSKLAALTERNGA